MKPEQFFNLLFLYKEKSVGWEVFSVNLFHALQTFKVPNVSCAFIRSVVRLGGLLQRLLPDDSGNQDDPSPPGEGGKEPLHRGAWQRRVR